MALRYHAVHMCDNACVHVPVHRGHEGSAHELKWRLTLRKLWQGAVWQALQQLVQHQRGGCLPCWQRVAPRAHLHAWRYSCSAQLVLRSSGAEGGQLHCLHGNGSLGQVSYSTARCLLGTSCIST